jgi:hypothetical protein
MREGGGEMNSEKSLEFDRRIFDLKALLKDEEKRTEMLTFALERIAACDWPGPSPLVRSRADWMQEIAREALK